jgi:predicted permease
VSLVSVPEYVDAYSRFIITKWNQTLFAMIGFTIINMAGTIVLITVPPSGSTRVGLFIAFNLMQAFAAVNPAIFLMLSRNSAGSTKKSFTYALTCTFLFPLCDVELIGSHGMGKR